MEIGLGILALPPDAFWDMSLTEFYAACDGLQEFHSGGKPKPMTRPELEDLMERYPD
jgi:uncharacterized phage protein (TIGR02216 family)